MPVSLFLDDLAIGQQWRGGPIQMTEADIVRFAREYDPQPMHVDRQAAADGRFGGIIASGWHVASLVMRDFIDKAPFGDTPMLGVRIDDLQWLRPVRPGDTLHILREIVSVKPSSSGLDRGMISMRMTITNQDDVEVMSFVNLIQIPARPRGMADG